MQAIRTKYIGATNTKPSRMQAKCEAKTIMASYDHSLDIDGNHEAVCKALCNQLGWLPNVFGGQFDGCCYWVFGS